MCRWKSPRSRLHYERSGPATIRRVSTAALAARDEQARIAHLVALPGVSVATASAILTLIDPARYGVLDIRCWQLLLQPPLRRRQSARAGLHARRSGSST